MSLRAEPADLLDLADRVLAAVPHGDAEVTVIESDSALTRYADNAIHQNVADASLVLRLRLQHEGRAGVAWIRGRHAGDDSGAVARLVGAAEEARRQEAPRELPPLPEPDGPIGAGAYEESTADAAPERRADLVGVVAAAAAAAGLRAYGAMSTSARQVALVNTRGLRRHARASFARMLATGRGDDGAGYAARCATSLDAVDAAGLAAEVVETTRRNQGGATLDPGEYEVVLSPYATAELLAYLGGIGFNALASQEGRSGIHLGERQASAAVTLVDDATDPDCAAFPFDAEGTACRPVTLIRDGVSTSLVHDTPTAMAAGVASTGHSLPQPNSDGPVPEHLAVLAGDADDEALIAGVERGLWITRLWYIRVVHELHSVVTGTTREGAFLIEKGRVVGPVRDLRFTQSILGALAEVRQVGSRRLLLVDDDEMTAVLTPALHIGRFSFTS